MENRLYLENGDGYIGLIYVAEVNGDKWQAIAHYPQNGPAIFYHDTKVDSTADLKLVIESFCEKHGIKIMKIEPSN